MQRGLLLRHGVDRRPALTSVSGTPASHLASPPRWLLECIHHGHRPSWLLHLEIDVFRWTRPRPTQDQPGSTRTARDLYSMPSIKPDFRWNHEAPRLENRIRWRNKRLGALLVS